MAKQFHDILQKLPLILRCEEWPVIAVFWVFKPLGCEFTQSVGALEHSSVEFQRIFTSIMDSTAIQILAF
jgi:hypothetical protein